MEPPSILDLIRSLFEEPHLVRVFHLRIRMNGSRPWLMVMMMMTTHTYRARPVVSGGCGFTLALRLGRTGRDLIAPWLLGQVVETVWVVSANLIDRWWLSVYGYSSALLQG